MDETEDIEDGETSPPFPTYREMASEDMLLLRGLPTATTLHFGANMQP